MSWADRLYSRRGWQAVVALPLVAWLAGSAGSAVIVSAYIRMREFDRATSLFVVVWVILVFGISIGIVVVHAVHACAPLRRFARGEISASEAWTAAVALPITLLKVNVAIVACFTAPIALFVVSVADTLSTELVLFYTLASIGVAMYSFASGVFVSNVVMRPVLRDIATRLDGPPPAGAGILLTTKLLFVVPGISVATAMAGAGVALSPGEDLGDALAILVIATLTSAAGAIPVTMLLAKSVRDPIVDLLEGTRRIQAANYSNPVPQLSSDELGHLARSFNEAMEGLTERQRLSGENLSLLEEVRASRVRIVAASDASRRRIERNLHDGAQQRLVALALDLRLLEESARTISIDEVVAAVGQATDDVKQALDELRELARGLHPTVLTTDGLAPALSQLAARAKLPVTVGATSERFAQEVESAAYFVAAEALANVAKYAHASEARVSAQLADGELMVEIADDGIGGATVGSGTGLAGLADRVAALDGNLRIDSPAGQGTKVIARIPLNGNAVPVMGGESS